MNKKSKLQLAQGFTLVELLIVVIIVAILAAVVIPQFQDSTKEAKESSLKANLAAVRSAIELYKLQHRSTNPGFSTAVPSSCSGTAGTGTGNTTTAAAATTFIEQLTMPTNVDGQACSIADANFKYGPYLKTGIPADSMKEIATVVATIDGAALTADAGNPGGWKVDVKSGQFITNNGTTDSKGKAYSSY